MSKEKLIQPGDLVTLKGMSKTPEKPIGLVKRKWATSDVEIIWLNESIAKRYAVHKIVSHTRLEIVSKASQQSS
tara:strand:- start:212 stop:433 length:222 start_codon:yes stop_codon:yes gene_type:complete